MENRLAGGNNKIRNQDTSSFLNKMLFPYIKLSDYIRHAPWAREMIGWKSLLESYIPGSRESAVASRCRALGFAESEEFQERVQATLAPVMGDNTLFRKVLANLPRYRSLVPTRSGLTRSIVLKSPGQGGEKGVLLLYFEYNWARLLLGLSDDQLRWMDEHYHIVLSTSWSPTDYAALALACGTFQGPIWVQACNYLEIPKIEKFHPRLKCLNSLPCDWINPDHYQPKEFADREIDIVMVANWGEFKRHWDFFEALAKMPENLNIVLIGQKEGGKSLDFILEQARRAGVRQNIKAFESIPIAEVTRHQQNAKISVIMSRREGCCVAAVESLFAGCALAMRTDAHVGPLHYINAETGLKVRPGHIAADLMELLERASGLRPREWAIKNISCHETAGKLNAELKNEFIRGGGVWTRDIIVPQWRPYPTFICEEDSEEQRPAYDELHHLFPTVFPADLRHESWR